MINQNSSNNQIQENRQQQQQQNNTNSGQQQQINQSQQYQPPHYLTTLNNLLDRQQYLLFQDVNGSDRILNLLQCILYWNKNSAIKKITIIYSAKSITHLDQVEQDLKKISKKPIHNYYKYSKETFEKLKERELNNYDIILVPHKCILSNKLENLIDCKSSILLMDQYHYLQDGKTPLYSLKIDSIFLLSEKITNSSISLQNDIVISIFKTIQAFAQILKSNQQNIVQIQQEKNIFNLISNYTKCVKDNSNLKFDQGIKQDNIEEYLQESKIILGKNVIQDKEQQKAFKTWYKFIKYSWYLNKYQLFEYTNIIYMQQNKKNKINKLAIFPNHSQMHLQSFQKKEYYTIILSSYAIQPFYSYMESEIKQRFQHLGQIPQIETQIFNLKQFEFNPNYNQFQPKIQNEDLQSNLYNFYDFLFNIADKIPNGILVIFRSKDIFDDFKSLCHEDNKFKLKQLEEKKPCFWGYSKTTSLQTDYQEKSKTSKGAIYFDAHKHFINQDLQFLNEQSRALFIVGYFYPSEGDKSIQRMKQQMQQAEFQNYKDYIAKRDINQLLGRTIVQENHQSILYLCDKKIKEQKYFDEKIYKYQFDVEIKEVIEETEKYFYPIMKKYQSSEQTMTQQQQLYREQVMTQQQQLQREQAMSQQQQLQREQAMTQQQQLQREQVMTQQQQLQREQAMTQQQQLQREQAMTQQQQLQREQAMSQQLQREQAMKEQLLKQQVQIEQLSKQQVQREEAQHQREQAMKEQLLIQQVQIEQFQREQVQREEAQHQREQAMKEQLLIQQVQIEQFQREQVQREEAQHQREQAMKEQLLIQQVQIEQFQREQAQREEAYLQGQQATREQLQKVKAQIEQLLSEEPLRGQSFREQEQVQKQERIQQGQSEEEKKSRKQDLSEEEKQIKKKKQPDQLDATARKIIIQKLPHNSQQQRK